MRTGPVRILAAIAVLVISACAPTNGSTRYASPGPWTEFEANPDNLVGRSVTFCGQIRDGVSLWRSERDYEEMGLGISLLQNQFAQNFPDGAACVSGVVERTRCRTELICIGIEFEYGISPSRARPNQRTLEPNAPRPRPAPGAA